MGVGVGAGVGVCDSNKRKMAMCGESRVALKGSGPDTSSRYSLHGFLNCSVLIECSA